AIAACDLAEVLGAAIGLNLLFGLPLLLGVVLTALDTILMLYLTNFGVRAIEAFVLSLVTLIGGCFFVEILFAKPAVSEIVTGLVPRLNGQSLYVAIGILGATVMPHNLYLHSALVQTRRIGEGDAAKRSACRFNLVDSAIALNGALLVNAAILIVAATVFFKRGIVVTEIQQAHMLLEPLLGSSMAGVLFAGALLCAGLSSTMTGTMAGQIVMEGFLQIRLRPWLRRLITRMAAIVPAALTIVLAGEGSVYQLLILSQVILSLQLPFAVIPLVRFTSDRKRMGVFANPVWVKSLAWAAAAIIVALNLRLAAAAAYEWLRQSGPYRPLLIVLGLPFAAALLFLLGWVAFEPVLPRRWRRLEALPALLPEAPSAELDMPRYRTILVPLDHTDRDRTAVKHAVAMAALHGAKLYVLHVEEDVTSQWYGSEALTAEVEAGRRYIEETVERLRARSIDAEAALCHSSDPREEIVRFARRVKPDLVVMGAHGHKWFQDLIFGNTIDAVRHDLNIPVLIVRGNS
ncbi:MAG: Nramp family divalent metal transporter, partial [Bryobacteraceae bacterium]